MSSSRRRLAVSLAQPNVEGDHLLVVPLHEIDLDAFDSPALIGVEDLVQARLDMLPVRPQQQADTLVGRIFGPAPAYRWRVRTSDVRPGVGLAAWPGVQRPAGIDQEVGEPRCRGEIDESAVTIHARLFAGGRPGPPVPRGQARLHPRKSPVAWGARLPIRWDSIRSPARSPIITTRHALSSPLREMTATSLRS